MRRPWTEEVCYSSFVIRKCQLYNHNSDTHNRLIEQEDNLLRYHRIIFGKNWSKIARHVPGRTANQIKDR